MSSRSLPDLKQRVLRAGSLSVLAFGSGQLLRLASNLIVARLVSPGDFGLMAVATATLVVLTLLSDVGLRQCVVQSPRGDTPALLHTAWTLQAIRGVVIFFACALIGWVVYLLASSGLLDSTSVYGHAELPAVIAAMGLTAVILGFNTARSYSTQRRLDLKIPTLVELGSQAAGIAVTLALAFQGPSVWAFVWGAVAGALVQVLMNAALIPGPRDRFMLDRNSIKELVEFGRWILLSSVVFVLASTVDRLALGYWVSPATLGIYSIALALATLPEHVIGRLLNAVALPALSEIARDDPTRLASTYYRFRLPLDLFVLCLSGILFAVGPGVISLLYDSRYSGAGPVLQILSLSAVFARHGLDGCLYMAIGRPRHMSTIHVLKLISLLVFMPLGYHLGGFPGAVLGIALVALPTLPLIYWINWKLRILDWRRELLTLPAWPAGLALGQLCLALC